MRRRLTVKAIEDIEAKAGTMAEDCPAVIAICDMNRDVVRKWQITKTGVVATDKEPTLYIPERLEKIIFPKRKKIIWGGRGSGKTRTVVGLLNEISRVRKTRTACFREIQDSIADSSYQELVDDFERRGMEKFFRPIERRIRVPNTKSAFSFDGLYRNLTKLKGKANCNVAWVEEAENVSRQSWDYLIPTFRADGSEIMVTFNPAEETDPTWADLVAPFWKDSVDGIYEDEDNLIIECNWIHNPWFTEVLRKEKDLMRQRDHDRYMWIWEGKFRTQSDVKVLNGKWRINEFTPDANTWDGPYFGADFGFAQDPSTLVKCWIHDENLYVEREAGGVGIELDDMPDMYEKIDGVRRHRIYGDCSRPETISHLKNKGFDIKPCDKWAGSVEDGITYLRSFKEIIVHPRCREVIYECNAYSYKVDRLSGDILPLIVDKDNHYIDAIRYALNNMIKGRGKMVITKEAIQAASRFPRRTR